MANGLKGQASPHFHSLASEQPRQDHGAAVTSLLSDIYGDDNRSVLEVALDQATPDRMSKRQVERCIQQLSPDWDDEQLKAVVSMFKAHGLL